MVEELPVPVLRPNEAMFREAIAAGGRIGMLATFAPAVPTMEEEFAQFVAETGASSTLETIVVPDAIDLLRQGDAQTHNRLVAEAAPRFAGYDAIMLAHFSTSRAADAVRAKVKVPVLSAPEAAVSRMRTLVIG
jgi:aspartate/glutamate racemase